MAEARWEAFLWTFAPTERLCWLIFDVLRSSKAFLSSGFFSISSFTCAKTDLMKPALLVPEEEKEEDEEEEEEEDEPA